MIEKTSQFNISYDGAALAGHEMDVKDLAPALMAVGELLEDANRVLNGDQARIRVNIKAPQQGSVEVAFNVIQDFVSTTRSLFSGDGVSAILNAHQLLEILLGTGTGGAGVIGLLKWLRNRKIKSITKIEVGGFKIETEDGETKIVKETEVRLFSFVNIRKRIEAIVKPLQKEGVEKIKFSNHNIQQEVVKEEVPYFVSPGVVEEVIDQKEYSENLQIVNISFQEDGKWKFFDGTSAFFAEILDQDFLDKIKRNEQYFAKDDILNVQLKRVQTLVDGTIKNSFTITKVLDHRSAAVQIKLPFSN